MANVTPLVNASTRQSGANDKREGPIEAAGHQPGESVHAPNGNQNAERTAAGCQQQALGQELAHNPRASGAQRLAHGQLLLPISRARQNQTGHIGAGDEQDKAHRGHDEFEHGCNLAALAVQSLSRRQEPQSGRVALAEDRLGEVQHLRVEECRCLSLCLLDGNARS